MRTIALPRGADVSAPTNDRLTLPAIRRSTYVMYEVRCARGHSAIRVSDYVKTAEGPAAAKLTCPSQPVKPVLASVGAVKTVAIWFGVLTVVSAIAYMIGYENIHHAGDATDYSFLVCVCPFPVVAAIAAIATSIQHSANEQRFEDAEKRWAREYADREKNRVIWQSLYCCEWCAQPRLPLVFPMSTPSNTQQTANVDSFYIHG